MSRLYPFTYWIKNTAFGEKYLVAKPEDESGIGTLMRFRDKLIAERQSDIAAGKTSGRIGSIGSAIPAQARKPSVTWAVRDGPPSPE